jgi:DNA-binding NtrC family response regulator
MKNGRILVIDDDEGVLESCRAILEDEGLTVKATSQGADGLELLRKQAFDVVLTDLKMPGMDGMEVLEQSLEINPDTVVVIFSAFGTVDSAVEAVKKGAFNYITKPYTSDQLIAAIGKALEHGTLVLDNTRLKNELEQCCLAHDIVGQSPELDMVLTTVAKVAPSDANVLITGESGTGKELVARALHKNSRRNQGPFIPVDCAALPSNLLESELFGHEKGAFTGADKAKRGLLEMADGGTLFLDEIGELSPELQAKLLRTLQERSFRRLGGERLVEVDIRILCSTNRDLTAEVENGRFRQDLLFRLNVVTLVLPPLRDRRGDVAILAQHFLRVFGRASGKALVRITPDALRLLERYQWPGNVREMRNVIERAIVLCDGETVRVRDLPDYIREQAKLGKQIEDAIGFKAAREQWMDTRSKQYLTALLRRHRGNVSAVAREAQISRKSVYELMRRHEIDPHEFHPRPRNAEPESVTSA